MKADTVFKILIGGVLILYAGLIVGLCYGCYACFDGLVLVVGFWQYVRFFGGALLGFMALLAAMFWLFLLIRLVREVPSESIPVTDEEAAQFDKFLKELEEKKKK